LKKFIQPWKHNTLTQHFHSTLKEKRITFTLINIRKFNGKVKFITQCTETFLLMNNR